MAGPAEQRPTKATSPEIEYNDTLMSRETRESAGLRQLGDNL